MPGDERGGRCARWCVVGEKTGLRRRLRDRRPWSWLSAGAKSGRASSPPPSSASASARVASGKRRHGGRRRCETWREPARSATVASVRPYHGERFQAQQLARDTLHARGGRRERVTRHPGRRSAFRESTLSRQRRRRQRVVGAAVRTRRGAARWRCADKVCGTLHASKQGIINCLPVRRARARASGVLHTSCLARGRHQRAAAPTVAGRQRASHAQLPVPGQAGAPDVWL